MPHLPRAPRISISGQDKGPGRVVPAPTSTPEEPYRGGTPDVSGQTGLSSVPRVSVRRWEYDPLRVFKLAFGTEPDVDEHTGQLVFPRGRR